jgi:hypothetical protein
MFGVLKGCLLVQKAGSNNKRKREEKKCDDMQRQTKKNGNFHL